MLSASVRMVVRVLAGVGLSSQRFSPSLVYYSFELSIILIRMYRTTVIGCECVYMPYTGKIRTLPLLLQSIQKYNVYQ